MWYGHIDFPPLEPQEPNEKYNDNTSKEKIEAQTQNTWNELWNTLEHQQDKTVDVEYIEPLPIGVD